MDRLPRPIKLLLIANVAVFLIDYATGGAYLRPWLDLDPDRTVHGLQLWRLVTYLFVHDIHAPFFHIIFNMLILWMFGVELSRTWGERKFWIFYCTCGVFAAALSLAFFYATDRYATVIGASGALFGLMFAFAKLFPTRPFQMFFLFSVEARYAVLIIGAVELLSVPTSSPVAHITHVGGILYAFLFFRFEDQVAGLWDRWRNRKAHRLQKEVRKSEEELGQVMVDIDPILKKISRTGMSSLTKEEKDMLQKASDLKKKQRSNIVSWDEYRNRQ